MKKLSPFLLLFFVLIQSCEKEPESDIPDGTSGEKPLAEAIIGIEGGKLESEDFRLTIPAGALNETTSLELFIEENDESFGSNKVSQTFRIKGLTKEWSRPLSIEVKYTGTLEAEVYIAMGYKHYLEEWEDTTMVNDLLDAVDSIGFLKATIPPLISASNSTKSYSKGQLIVDPIVLHHYLIFRGIHKMETLQSECMEIKYERDLKFNKSKLEQFARDMDDAAYIFAAMNLMDIGLFQNEKIKVLINSDKPESAQPIFIEPEIKVPAEIHPATLLKILNSKYRIHIPENYFLNASNKELKMIAGEGVFRYETYCMFANNKAWLHWAFFFWVREFFYGSIHESLSGVVNALFMQPFKGMNSVERIDIHPFLYGFKLKDKIHGFGMSALMKYLLENYSENLNLIAKIYLELLKTTDTKGHPIDAILKSVEAPENDWWPGFIKDYLIGNIWDIPAEKFIEKIKFSDEVHFIDETDTVKYLERSYPDLSAQLFKINLATYLSVNVLDDSDKLNFKLGPGHLNLDYVTVLLFGYKDGKLTYLNEGNDINLENLKSMIDNGYTTLIAAVVNSANEYPFEEDMNIELAIRIKSQRAWSWKYLSIDAQVANAIFRSSTGEDYLWDKFKFELNDRYMNASDDGARFTTSWAEETSGFKFEGGIDITIDTLNFEIIDFYAWTHEQSISDNKVTLSEKKIIRSNENMSIPVAYLDNDYLTHLLTGEDVCSALHEFTYEYRMYPGEDYEYSNTLVSYTCNEDANILFLWARQKEE